MLSIQRACLPHETAATPATRCPQIFVAQVAIAAPIARTTRARVIARTALGIGKDCARGGHRVCCYERAMKFVVPALAFATLAAAAACGDNLDAVPDGDTPPADPCTTLVLGQRDFHFDLFGQMLGMKFPVETAIGGSRQEELLVELYDSSTGGLPPLTTGTFALDAPPNDNLATCQHCIWFPIDWDGFSPIQRIMYAVEGSITLEQVEDPMSIVFAAGTSEVLMREAEIDEKGNTTFVDGGRCVRLAPQTIDTRPTPGQACLSAEDCGNAVLEVCSPATNTCTEPECGEELGCPAERPTCVIQYGDQLFGACYAPCNPSTPTDCAAGETCLQFGVSPEQGLCYDLGAAAVGDACTVEDNSSSCAAGARCSPAVEVCTNTCDFFAADPGCQDGTQCNLFGVCEPLFTADPAALGESCAATAEMAAGCAADGDAFRGICFSYSPVDPMTCSEACLGDLGCEPEEFCALRFTSGLGICLPDPVCGDGDLGEIDETCDDGNTVSGDGCSANCQTVEYGPICAGADAVAPNTTLTGSTAGAWDGFQASCQLGIARADVFTFTPPGRGRLRLTSNGATQHVVSLRTDCADAGSELACADDSNIPNEQLIHQVTDAAPAPITLMVSAWTVIEQGDYSVEVEWTDESCGDGVIAGREVCDDGNTASNDGCRADCGAIEYTAACTLAPPLALDATITGDLTNAPNYFTASCSNDIYGSGVDTLYRVTAPAAGTLRISIPESSETLTYAVLDVCGDAGTYHELACARTFIPEPIEVAVTAGQTVTVLVEGYSPWEAGSFSLRAEMVP
jgi:cysteine-rich repeat protein